MADTGTTDGAIEIEPIDLGCIINQYRQVLEGMADKFGNVLPTATHRLETIRDNLRGSGSVKDINGLEQIIEELNGLNDNLRDYVRNGLLLYCLEGLNIQDLDLYDDIIEPVLEDHGLAGKMHKKQVSVDHENSLENGVHILGDLKHLRRVYEILFLNAIEHAVPRTRFSYGIEKEDGHYNLNVFNVSDKLLDEGIFERDYQLMGVKKIIEAHGGDIRVDSGEKNGRYYINVVFTLPKSYETSALPQTL